MSKVKIIAGFYSVQSHNWLDFVESQHWMTTEYSCYRPPCKEIDFTKYLVKEMFLLNFLFIAYYCHTYN